MIVKSVIYKVIDTGKKTSAEFFEKLNVGDLIQVNINMGTKVSRGVSKMVTIENLTTKDSRTDNSSIINKGLEKLKLEEYRIIATAGC